MNSKDKVADKPKLPRQIAPGVYWHSACLPLTVNGVELHNHNSCYLITGSEATILIDTGPPFGWANLQRELRTTLSGRSLDYIFPTHPESPHMGNIWPLLEEHPHSLLVGDLRNYELYAPSFCDRFRHVEARDWLSLGDRDLIFAPAAVHDLPNTLWAYETLHRILFVSDGYPYTHDHLAGECALTSVELLSPPSPDDTAVVIEGALGWTRHVDSELTIADLDAVLAEFPPALIAPTHGGVILNPSEITEVFKAGLRGTSGMRSS